MPESLSSTANNSQSTQNVTTDKRPYRVALLCGGTSSEREVSLASAANVQQVLADAGHKIIKIDTADPDFIQTLFTAKPDVAFIALHGKGGEDGSLQGALELMGIPYTGSGVLGSALAMDKHRSKIMYQAHGVDTAPWICLKAHEQGSPSAEPARIIKEIGLPAVVKPINDGSSMGVTIVKNEEDLPEALQRAFKGGSDVLVEQFIKGTEITVGVLGTEELQALPSIEIVPKNEFYDYESKYADGGSEHIIPARLESKILEEASEIALTAHRALGCSGMSRTDMIVDEDSDIWVIETNTIPGMTGTSLLPEAAKYIGISNKELYERFIEWAIERA